MINRTAQAYLKSLQRRFPIVTVIGPRQSGKTTLVQASFPEKPYANLENPADFQFAQEDPLGFIYQYPDGCIIDEIQRVPELLSVLQVVSDDKQTNGLFIITGSQQFVLMEKITQSLAGRTFILKLLPLSIEELDSANQLSDLNQTLLQGFYPRMYAEETIPSELMQSYFETYVQKDVRQVLNIKDIAIFQKFVGLCAGRIGQLLNKESLANDIGINIKTVEEWISVLETSFVLFRLQPFWRNSRKRLTKSPKLYFYDVGMASWLLRIQDSSAMVNHPFRGNLFENMIIVEALKNRFNAGKDNNLFFYRDGKKREIDLVIDEGQQIFPIEIKSAATYNAEFSKNLGLVDDYGTVGKAVVFGADTGQNRSNLEIISWRNFSGYLGRYSLV